MDLDTTPTELALRRRITQLEAKLAMHEGAYSLRSFQEPVTVSMQDPLPSRITLEKRAALVANINERGRLVVRVESRSAKKLIVAHYTHCEDGYRLTEGQAADVAAHLHKAILHDLANVLYKGEFEDER